MAFVSVTLYLTVTNFLWGQLFRPQFFSISVPLIDICLPLLATANLLNHLRRQQLKPHQQYFFYFLIYTFANLILNIYLRHLNPIKPIFYFIRLSTLLSLFIWPINPQILNRKFYLFLNLILISNIIVGLIQYFLWPDFRSFSAQGWDPHLYRLVSTFFDPTFTALIYLLLLIQNFISHPNYPLLFINYIAIALTYSRSSFLSFWVTSLILSTTTHRPKIFVTATILLGLTLLALPRLPGEGTKLERTSSIFAKIENYREGIALFAQSPLIGYGYNTLEQTRTIKPTSHAANGFDNSILTIFVTTGLIGGILFTTGLISLWLSSSLIFRLSLLAVLIHSLFANSLLYPWILFYLALISSPNKSTTKYHK